MKALLVIGLMLPACDKAPEDAPAPAPAKETKKTEPPVPAAAPAPAPNKKKGLPDGVKVAAAPAEIEWALGPFADLQGACDKLEEASGVIEAGGKGKRQCDVDGSISTGASAEIKGKWTLEAPWKDARFVGTTGFGEFGVTLSIALQVEQGWFVIPAITEVAFDPIHDPVPIPTIELEDVVAGGSKELVIRADGRDIEPGPRRDTELITNYKLITVCGVGGAGRVSCTQLLPIKAGHTAMGSHGEPATPEEIGAEAREDWALEAAFEADHLILRNPTGAPDKDIVASLGAHPLAFR